MFEARLALEGYRSEGALVMVLEGELRGEAKPCEIREIRSEADWSAYTAMREMDWRAYVERQGKPYDETEAEALVQVVRCTRAKSPPARHWVAIVDDEARAYLSSWEGIDGLGQVEDLFTHPEFRHRGLATALIHHGVADCRAQGAGPVTIAADPTDTPKNMYAAMGFRPVAVKREYWKQVEP